MHGKILIFKNVYCGGGPDIGEASGDSGVPHFTRSRDIGISGHCTTAASSEQDRPNTAMAEPTE